MNELEHQRSESFVEKLSIILVIGAYLGGFIVLLDIKFVLTFGEQVITIGKKEGFSPELIGVVLQSMLITGFAAVVGYWLSTTKQGQEQAQTMSKIAEAPTVAATIALNEPKVTAAPINPATGIIPAVEVAMPPPSTEKGKEKDKPS